MTVEKIIITSDVHGSYSTWITILGLLKPGDGLAVAGDLFGTRYPDHGNPDYQPETIKESLADLKHPFYYVYGNCDREQFSPGYKHCLSFDFMGSKIFMHHGHRFSYKIPSDVSIVIHGHTHKSALKKDRGIVFINPGSLSMPRDMVYTYAVMDRTGIQIINIKTGKSIASMP